MATDKKVVLTGIKPTGDLHIGNALGAIFPGIEQVKKIGGDSYFFIADLHALNQISDPKQLSKNIKSVIAAWLACGITDFENVVFYRQSDIQEVCELATYLTAITPKSIMNNAHAYKAAVQKNKEAKIKRDSNINMGLYTYPLLMAADILIVKSDIIPVGSDQIQHVEIAKFIAEKFNFMYGDVFHLPEHAVMADVSTVPGIDGRKMSKSYNNTIPLFATKEEWKELVMKIKTDSTPRGQGIPDVEETTLYKIYKSISTAEQSNKLLTEMSNGSLGWKDAKDALVEQLAERFGEMNEKYNYWLHADDKINEILLRGKETVTPIARDTIRQIRSVTGMEI